MAYIDWYSEKAKKEKKIFEKRQEGYKEWVDLVTGTQYCISEADYNRIYKTGQEKLEQLLQDQNLKEMEQLFYGRSGILDIELFPDLPWFVENVERCARIRDHVCFRTACLYALKYHSIHNTADLEQEKDRIRMQGFTWRFVDHAESSPELEWLEDKDLASPAHRADLVKGGMIKIKQYYLETSKIPEIRGASLLLDRVNDEKTRELICREHIRECLIYAGGGKIMGIFPEGTGEDICQKLGLLVENETITAQYNFYSRPYEIQRLLYDYRNITDEMDMALEERQGLRWDFRLEPQICTEELTGRDGWSKIEETTREFCTSCRIRHAVASFDHEGDKEKLCPSCLYKKRAGGREAKRSRHQAYKSYVRKKYGNVLFDDKKAYNKLEDIADNGFIGIIYGDANSMSSHIHTLQSFMMMRYFSEITADTVTEIVYDALYKNLGNQLSFEVIAVGGDDIFLIVPGSKAYGIACMIGKNFDQRFRNLSNGECNMTMSVGVCIAHDKMPVQYSFTIAQDLLKSAKQKAWQERKSGNKVGTIDWMVIENAMSGSTDLAYQRKEENDKPEKTLRPYTWKQAEAIRKFIQRIEKEKTFAFQLRQSWYMHTREEAELFYAYQLGRKRETKVSSALEQLARAFDGETAYNNIQSHGVVYSPWLDVIEIWDYVGDMG